MTVLPDFQIRRWLNREDHGGSAHVYAYIFDPRGMTLDAEFALGDCNRQTRLDFSIYDEQDAALALFKLKALESAVQEFARAFRERVAQLSEAPKAP